MECADWLYWTALQAGKQVSIQKFPDEGHGVHGMWDFLLGVGKFSFLQTGGHLAELLGILPEAAELKRNRDAAGINKIPIPLKVEKKEETAVFRVYLLAFNQLWPMKIEPHDMKYLVTVQELLDGLAKASGDATASERCVVFNGEFVDKDRSLHDLNIAAESTLHVGEFPIPPLDEDEEEEVEEEMVGNLTRVEDDALKLLG